MRHGLRAFVVFACVFCFFPFQTDAALSLLTQDLQKGMTSSEVKILQEFLNTDTATRVSLSGIGSKGFETTYFGSLTETAVRKFQEKYKGELSLSGTYLPNGKVDLRTRGKINNLILANYISSEGLSAPKGSTDVSLVKKPEGLSITSIEPENPAPGDTVHIYGTGFTRNSRVYFGMDNKVSFDYVDSGHMTVKAPNKDLSADLIYIRNYLGDTRWTDPVFAVTTKKKIEKSGSSRAKSTFKELQKANDSQTKVAVEDKIDDKNLSLGDVLRDIFSPTKKAYAFSMNMFFGGDISQTYYCTCYYDFGIIIDVNDDATDMTYTTVYKPGISDLNKNYNVYTSGPNLVGGTTQTHYDCNDTYVIPPGELVCEQSTSGGTSAENMIDFIRGTGTSYF